jgi:predicted DNA binding CopG/RHH family protein
MSEAENIACLSWDTRLRAGFCSSRGFFAVASLARLQPLTWTAKFGPHTTKRGNGMKKKSSSVDPEAAFADEIYRDRAALNRKAQEVLAAGSRQVTIRLDNSEIALAKQQAKEKGLRYQTYVKMLLHQALIADRR